MRSEEEGDEKNTPNKSHNLKRNHLLEDDENIKNSAKKSKLKKNTEDKKEDEDNNNSLSYMPPDKVRFQIEKNISFLKNTLEMIFIAAQNKVGEFETKTDGYQLLNYSCSYTIGENDKTHKLIIQLNMKSHSIT